MKSRALTALAASLSAACLAGCASVPPLDVGHPAIPPAGAQLGQPERPGLPGETINEVLCELSHYVGDPRLADYAVSFNLKMETTDGAGLTPSLNWIHVLHGTSKTLTHAAGGELSGSRLRNYTNNFSAFIADVPKLLQARGAVCSDQGQGSQTAGPLRLDDVIDAGLMSMKGFDGLTLPKDGSPAFGAEVQFALTRSLNGGPTWSETHFKGPAGDKGLVNASRVDTNTLTIAFARAESSGNTMLFLGAASPRAGAISAAQSHLQLMLLQDLTHR